MCAPKRNRLVSQADWHAGGNEGIAEQLLHVAPSVPETSKRAIIKLLQLKECVTVSSMVDRDDIGEMMHEEAFIHWAKKPNISGLSDRDTKLRFVQVCEEPGAVTDMDGRQADKPRQVRAATTKLVIFATGSINRGGRQGSSVSTRNKSRPTLQTRF